MSIYRMTLRFNLEDETERKAAEFLKQLDCKEHKSKNHFVIDLITAYIDSLNKDQQEDAFIEKIRFAYCNNNPVMYTDYTGSYVIGIGITA